jgi:hypothetical protein
MKDVSLLPAAPPAASHPDCPTIRPLAARIAEGWKGAAMEGSKILDRSTIDW